MLLLTGCPREAARPAPSGEPPASVALRVLVVNDPALAEAINRLRGEWAERRGGELQTSFEPWQDVVAQKAIQADLVVFPSRYLGELCVRDWLRAVRPHVLESNELRAADFFPVVRHQLISWGGETMALPLGIEPVGIGERTDLPPALALLGEAAPQALSRDRLGFVFDSETMKPRISEPPFVEALTRMASAEQDAALLPSAGGAAAIVGYSDRLVAVTSSSRNAASAFQLLEWLTLPETSSQLARAGNGTMPVRRSLASAPAWYEEGRSAGERAELGKRLEAALSRPESVIVPRIPGIDDYLAALDQAVGAAVEDGVAAQAALEKAARRWEEITETRGRDSQRQAYLKHLGIREP